MVSSVTETRCVHFRPTEIRAPMDTAATYRVVGVRADGQRVVISKHASLGVAERVVGLIGAGSQFQDLCIESEDRDGSPPRHEPADGSTHGNDATPTNS
jgi:hypothetical protein